MWKLRKTSHTHQAKHYRLHCSACWRTLMFGTNIACKLLGRRGCAWAGLCPPAQWSRGSSLGMDSGADTWITTQVIWIFLFKWKFCSSHRQFLQCYRRKITISPLSPYLYRRRLVHILNASRRRDRPPICSHNQRGEPKSAFSEVEPRGPVPLAVEELYHDIAMTYSSVSVPSP